MSKTIKASIILGWATLISLIVGVIRRKLLAIYLGPAGLGTFAQVFNYFNLTTIIASFGLSQGITTFIAKKNHTGVPKSELNLILNSAMSISLLFSSAIILITILFSKPISVLALGDKSVYYLLIFVSIGIPFQVFGESLLAYLQGIKNIKKISLASISISISGLIVSIPLIIFFKVFGAVLSTLSLAILTFIIYLYICRDSLDFRFFWKIFDFLKISKSLYYRKLFNFGFLRFIQTALSLLTFFIMRTIIIKKIGVASNGIYEAVYTFSLLYLPFLSNLLWSYCYPEYCQMQDEVALSKAVNKFLRLSLTIIFPILIVLLLARPLLVEKIIFTKQFCPAIKLIPIRFLVDLVIVITWSFSVVLLAKEKLWVSIKFEILKDVLFIGAILSISPIFKLEGILAMEVVAWSLFLSLSYRYIKRNFNFELSDTNKHLLISSILLFVTIAFFPVNNLIFIFLGLIILIVWIFKFVSRAEMKEILISLRIIDFNR
ncbi:MAG: oligosaccharide flippase family protein [Candidatus Omnitrophica bacterium]|nr:oligosaccharide flippase family protein [Candidatus Omnitrophota bacterium]